MLAGEVFQDAQRLVHLQLALARQEVKELVLATAISVGLMAGGGLMLALGVLVAVPSIVVLWVPWHWQAAAVWAAVYVLLGIGLFLFGRSRFHLKLPTKTIASLKENKEWAIRQIKSTAR